MLRWLLLLLGTLSCCHAAAQNFLVEQTDITLGRDKSKIQILFRAPVSMLNSSPKTTGSTLNIQIQTLGDREIGDAVDRDKTEWLGVNQPGYGQLFDSIGFRRTAVNQGLITINFPRVSEYTVTSGNAARGVIITIAGRSSRDFTSSSAFGADVPEPVKSSDAKPVSKEQEEAVVLMERARRAMAKQNYTFAIQLYTKIVGQNIEIFAKDALEFLGVARERKKQLAQANAVYRQYLERYPEGEDAERIKQRIAGLAAQFVPTGQKLRPPKKKQKKRDAEWIVYGSVAEYYRYMDLTIEALDETQDDETEPLESSLSSDLDLSVRRISENWDIRSRFSGGYISEFLQDTDGSYDRLSNMYIDIRDKRRDWSARLGRQTSSTGGVFGRFDGLLTGITLNEMLTLNLVTGFPVDSSTIVDVDSDRYFYGVNMDIGPFAGAWDSNLFYMEQKIDGILDRRAVGGEIRYFDAKKSLFTLVDYDLEFEKLNKFLLIGNWNIRQSTALTLNVDIGNSPLLTTRNAIQGQLELPTVDELLTVYTEEELRVFAEDRTAESRYITFGVTQTLSERMQIFANVSQSNFSSLPASAGVEAIEGTGDEYNYELQFIFNQIFMESDSHIVRISYFDGSASQRTSLRFDSRFALTRNFRINPRVRFDWRENTDNGQTQFTARPQLRFNYRWRKRHHIEMEIGYDWATRELTDALEEKTTGYLATLGYRYDFF